MLFETLEMCLEQKSYISGHIPDTARRYHKKRYVKKSHETLHVKSVGTSVQLVWQEREESVWETEAGQGSAK
jgi:hypothetical protein